MRIPSISQLRAGPPTADLMTAAAVLGIGRTRAYEMAHRGDFPVRVIRIGSTYRVPVAALLELLDISDTPPAPTRPLSERTNDARTATFHRTQGRPCASASARSSPCQKRPACVGRARRRRHQHARHAAAPCS